jgi:ribonuclease PH
MRPNGRKVDELREVKLVRQFISHPEGSVLIECGETRIICNASVSAGVPKFLKGTGHGWITAEYAMLPRSTKERMTRDITRGTATSRAQEIQRFIGRALRSCVNLELLGENTITIDCDVIQADGGTRTASVTGACIALNEAFNWMLKRKLIKQSPMRFLIGSVSVGMHKGELILDLDYSEDASAEVDMNVVMSEHGEFVEIQGTAEGKTFTMPQLNQLLTLAKKGIDELLIKQRRLVSL